MANILASKFYLSGQNGFSNGVIKAMKNAYAGFQLGGPIVTKSLGKKMKGTDVIRVLCPNGKIGEIPLEMTRFHDLDVVEKSVDGKVVRIAFEPKIESTNVLSVEKDRVDKYENFLNGIIKERKIEVVVEFGIGGSGNPKLTNYDAAVEHNLKVLEGEKRAPLYFMIGDKMSADQIEELSAHLKDKNFILVFSSMSGEARDTMSTIVATLQKLFGSADYEKILKNQVIAVTRDSNDYHGKFLYHLQVPANSEARQAKLMYATSTILLGGNMQDFLDGYEAEATALRTVAPSGRIDENDLYSNPNLALGAFLISQMYLARSIYILLGDGHLYPWSSTVKQILGESLGGKMKRGNSYLNQDLLANFIVTTPNDFHTELNDYALRDKIAFVAFLMEHVDPFSLPTGVPQNLIPIGEKFEGKPLEATRNMVNTAVLMDLKNNHVPWIAQDLNPEAGRDFWRGVYFARLLLGGTWLPGFALGLRPDTQDGVEGYKRVLKVMNPDLSTIQDYVSTNNINYEAKTKGGIVLK
jgi:hypothetical protein